MGASAVVQFVLSGVTMGSIYALVAIGFTLIFNTTDVINFAQGEFVMLGGMLAISLRSQLHWPLSLAVLGAVLIGALIGVLIERLTIARVRRASVMTLVMVTLGVSVVVENGSLLIWGSTPLGLEPFTSGVIHLFGAVLDKQTLWVLGIGLILVLSLFAFYRFTMLGQAMLACATDPEGAQLVGVPLRRMVLVSFALSAGIGALGGTLLAPIATARYDMGFALAVKGFAAAVLGGLGNSAGAIAGGLLLGLLEALSAGLISSSYKELISLAVLLAVLMLRPSGLLGAREERRHTAEG